MWTSRKAFLSLACTFALVATLSGGVASASLDGTSAARTARSADLSTRAGINSYLRSQGADPSRAVWQTGARNYAGPRCPGSGWTCTTVTDRPIVQRSSGGANVAECSAPCLVVQTGSVPRVNNSATCTRFRDNPAPTTSTLSQNCFISQSASGSGQNSATVNMTMKQKRGRTQHTTQHATVYQRSASGKNTATVTQLVGQDFRPASSSNIVQDQEAFLVATVDQASTASGDNSANVQQTLTQKAFATGTGPADVTQNQNATSPEPNAFADIDQCSGDTSLPANDTCTYDNSDLGNNDADLFQNVDQYENASTEGDPITQNIGSIDGGLDGHIDQQAHAVALANGDQKEVQQAVGKTHGAGPPNQTLIGPHFCCTDQFDDPGNQFNINQFSQQTTNNLNADITNIGQGNCESSGNCHIDQQTIINGMTTNNSCDDSSCHIGIECFTDGGIASRHQRPVVGSGGSGGGTFCNQTGGID